ncbi:MAG: DNA primase [Alphaproteobacteria bacterium]|nr:DNA primase [Alphaproteobacteria bacterium]MBU1513499.1 DNA primase [Alphaproteobacteria bacterium]MBU2096491.1 DNA primase [Alphaproteobacteria bacterium]MBU2149817.1 DNA primase [Alphaproteobacteria bacterium]MBU2305208.1 DNA primase [Alphaproteobacteria bacterium]
MVGRFDERFLEEVKSRLRPSDVIGRTVKLRKQGREYVGLSPFNKEKTPSFYVNDDKGQFFDFSSGKTGDLITFLQETERLTFAEAVERLAGEAGVPLPALDPRGQEQDKKRHELGDWLEMAAQWFEGELRRPVGREARAYLEKRGLPESEWARFRIGFSPGGRTALKDYLVTKGARPPELVETGLLIAPEDGGAAYDRFRDRIIFPILDVRGRVVSFGGRAMDPQARAKYLNGPETVVFHKGHQLYGLSEARKIIAAAPSGEDPPLVVVEGYMDVIACQRAGVPAVAAMGTALGEDQMEVLWRHHPEPTLCFDGDRAGRQAAGRAIDRALPLLKPGKSLKFALVEGGKDPDDVLRDQGPAVLKAQLSRTMPFAEALFTREKDLEDLDTPERKTALKVRLRKLAATIADPDLAAAYKEDLLARFEGLWPTRQPVYTVGAAGRELSRARWDKRKPPLTGAHVETKDAMERLRGAPRALSAALAVAAVRDPGVIDDAIERVGSHGFGDAKLDGLAHELVSLRYETEHLEMDASLRRLQAKGFSSADFVQLQKEADRAGVSAPFLKETGERARMLWRQAFDLLMQLESLERAVTAAAQDLSRDQDITALSSLKAERDQLRKLLKSDWANGEDGAVVLPH